VETKWQRLPHVFFSMKSSSQGGRMSEALFSPEQEEYIKEHMAGWLAEISLGKPTRVYEIELRERMIRVEEELKHQREIIQQILHQMDNRFEQVDKRFEQVDKRFEQVNKRFEQMDKRFEESRADMNARFEQMDKRFEELRADMNARFEQVDKRFEEMRTDMNTRFEQVDKRFEEMRMDMKSRFEQVDRRFEALTQRIDRFMVWSFATTLTVGALIIGVLKFT
jgi:DNA anti-recombination protein RmuC